jgi:hypothetical protein
MLLSTARRWLNRFRATPSVTPRMARVESMEERRYMAANRPSIVTSQQFIGTSETITAVVLTFNVPLDPVSAGVTDSYQLIKKIKKEDDGLFGGIGGFGGDEDETETDRIRIETATYDETANTVTLTPRRPFQMTKNFRHIKIKGTGDNALLRPDGTRIDGDGNGKAGGDAVLTFKAARSNSVSYKDADGDKVIIRLQGPGKILSLVPKKGPAAPLLFLRETDAATSELIGTVKKAKKGDGVTVIQQISGASTAQIAIANDPAFQIVNTVP